MYDTEILSKCSPHVYDTSRDKYNTPLLEFSVSRGEVAYDKNKQYTHILLTCGGDTKYGWPVYMPTDEVEVFDTVIETGRYWVNTSDGFALHGNGWYCDSVVEKIITTGYYQIKRY